MVEENTKLIKIDLNQFKLHLYLKSDVKLTLHFDSPSRRFYLSIIAFVIQEMKKRGRIVPIPLQNYIDILALLNETVGDAAGSSKKEYLLSRIYRKWKDALPDLENAPLFKVIGRKKRFDELMDKVYSFSEGEKDSWANLFEFKGSHEHVKLRFSIDRLGLTLDDVIIIFGEHPVQENVDAWERFILHLKNNLEEKSISGHSDIEPKNSELFFVRLKLWSKAMPKYLKWSMLCALLMFVFALATFAIWKAELFVPKVEVASIKKMAYPLPEKPSVAVLPFRNLSGDPKQNNFSDGLTVEITIGLSKIPSLFVIAPNSMFKYKQNNVQVRQVSEELGVQFVLEGSVRKAADRLRITAQLIDAVNGEYLWGERYDREIKDIFAIQDEITIKILTALQVELMTVDKSRLQEKKTNNLQAYLQLLEGRGYMLDFSIDASIKCFKEARVLDPLYAEAYALESFAHLHNYWFGPNSTRTQSLIKAIETVRKCEELDNELTLCNMVKGVVYTAQLDDFNALIEGKRAVERWPNSAEAATFLAMILQASGRYKEALKQIDRALRINPFRVELTWSILGQTYLKMGRYEEAIVISKKLVKLCPNHLPALMVLALAYGSEGRMSEARSVVNNIRQIRPNLSAYDFTMIDRRKTKKDINKILNGLL